MHRLESKEPELEPLPRKEITGATCESEQLPRVNRGAQVLLQVIPVTVYGPNGSLNTDAMLDSKSMRSLVLSGVADKLGLVGSEERVVLNGIEGTSELNSK